MQALFDVTMRAKEKLNFHFPYDVGKWLNEMHMTIENYHKHTTWSNLVQVDSATDVNEFMHKLDQYGCRCMFSGEHGFQGEWLYIYDLCKKSEGLKTPKLFRYSTEVYWVKDRKKQSVVGQNKNGESRIEKDRTNCHMIIVAKNYKAMRKVNYILSMANIDGFYGKPRIDMELLFQLTKEDVYITSACLAGWKYTDAKEIWLDIWRHFGDSFFLEYQAHNTERQIDLNKAISEMSTEYGIQTIIGLDTHYISSEDEVKRDNLLKRKGQHYEEESGWYMDFPDGETLFKRMQEQGVLSDEEIILAMMNTHVFLNGCENVEIDTDFKIPILPEYQKYDYPERVNILGDILERSFNDEEEQNRTKERHDGILYELEQIDKSTTADYFLTNHSIIGLATSEKYSGHLTTTSRGSASSYYSSKLLGFTTMDRFECEVPIYPERFITKERVLSSHQCPDIDYNVEKQDPFVQASRELLGEEGCYPLLAVGKLGEKSGFKLFADIKGVEPSIANDISKSIDQYNEELKYADDEDDRSSLNIEDFITDGKLLEIFEQSKSYQGIVEQAKCHACGHLIFNGDVKNQDSVGYGDIRYEIGLIRCHSESTGKSTLVACVEGGLLDAYGYVKNDYLIVDVVGIINKIYTSIGMPIPTVSDLRKMVDTDTETWRMYEIGATCCLNQCERASTTKRIMKYKPQNIKELAAFIAGIRPGFKSHLEGFINRIPYSNGEKAIDDLLEESFHYMLYQEAVMKIFSYLGIPMKESYDTIKKISKKKLQGKELEHVEQTLREHWIQNVGNLENFEPVYQVVKDSARYSFNAPHALAMANDSLYEAWAKAHHTSTFYEVALNHYQNKDDKNKVAALIKEAMKIFGYTMGSYEYGQDNSKFTVDDKNKIIYPSLSSVKGIGEKAVAQMMEFHANGVNDFLEVYGGIKGTNVNSTVFKNLVKIGYFKKFGSIKKLIETITIYDKWKGADGKGRKTISKSALSDLGITEELARRYSSDMMASGKVNDKKFTSVDWNGIVRELASAIPNEEYGICQLAKFQYRILGYVDYIDPSIAWEYIVVTDLNTQYSPKFNAYSINKGKSIEMKVHKKKTWNDKNIVTSFAEEQFENGDILYIKAFKKQAKKVNVNGEWIVVPDIYEWWIKDYIKI